MDFFTLLEKAVEKKNSLLCIGIDPQDLTPEESSEGKIYNHLVRFGERLVTETAQYAVCFKPNIAFYEAHGPQGLKALKKTIEMVPDDVPVIIDSKRSDIGNTAKAYARSLFGYYQAHATTLNPFLGRESVLPFLEWQGRGLFILCRTSNPGSVSFQEIKVREKEGGKFTPFYLLVAKDVSSWGKNIGLVVAGNLPEVVKEIRTILPDIWILAPGVGAQGGTVKEALEAGMRKDGSGILLNVSRAVSRADSPGKAAEAIRDDIVRVRKGKDISVPETAVPEKFRSTELHKKAPSEEKLSLVRDLIRAGCFELGRFKLKSGQLSPFYIDLRMIISSPALLSLAASAYSRLLQEINYERIAGIPYAGIPLATAVSMRLDRPMIFPRLEMKEHGTGRRIEGAYSRGESVVLLDDLITTGKSKIEAIEVLRGEGLVVQHLVVLVERGRSGREELSNAGVQLHSYLNISEFLDICFDLGMIDEIALGKIMLFIDGE